MFLKQICIFVSLFNKNLCKMGIELSKKQIGKRIAQLRKTKGLSQEELSKIIKIPRSSLALAELGKRSIDVIELQRLSMALGFSLDDFVSNKFDSHQIATAPESSNSRKVEERNAVPYLQIDKLKNVLLYVLAHCAGKPNVGETALNKLLYFIDFNYYELYEEHLTGAQYRKLPFGPVPQHLDKVIAKMILDKELQRIKTDYHGYPQTRFIPLVKANLAKFTANEKEVIDKVIEQMSDWSAAAISNYSHQDLPWQVTEEGKDINYELAFYRELPYSVRTYDENES